MNNLQTAGRARGHLLPRLGDEFRISVVEFRSGQGPRPLAAALLGDGFRAAVVAARNPVLVRIANLLQI